MSAGMMASENTGIAKLIFGRLTLDAIPYHDPIIIGTFIGTAVLGLALLVWVTKLGAWGYLWREWFTSIDHKKIGIMYIILGLVMLLRGFADAIMMRLHQAMAFGENLGYLPGELSSVGTDFLVDIRGKSVGARVVPTPLYRRSQPG